jgi:hypothetical protein
VIAETGNPGETFYACNYAVSFGDPLADTRLTSAEVSAFGAGSFLTRCDAIPDYPNDHCRAAIVHVTCSTPAFTDKGKVKLVVPDEVAGTFARVLWQAGKDLWREDRATDRAEQAHHRAASRLEQARAGTGVGAGLGPRRGDLDPQAGHGGRAVAVAGAPARGRR